MHGLEARSLDFDYVIRESLAGLARNIAVVKNLAGCDDLYQAIVAHALAGLDARDLYLLRQGNPQAATRAAAAVVTNVDRLIGFRDDWNSCLLAGEPLRLGDLIGKAGITKSTGFGGAVRASGSGWIGPDRISLVLDGISFVVFHDKAFLHRNAAEGPAVSVTGPGGDLMRALYLSRGVLHRSSNEGPAMLEFNAAGDCLFEGYFEHGRLHRDPKLGPACRTLVAEEGRERFEYFVDGLPHRDEEEGPAWIATSLHTGGTVEEGYYRRGEAHRQGGPATIIRNDEGALLFEAWFCNGMLDRDPAEGPAVICRKEDGRISTAEFWRNGVQLEDGADVEALT